VHPTLIGAIGALFSSPKRSPAAAGREGEADVREGSPISAAESSALPISEARDRDLFRFVRSRTRPATTSAPARAVEAGEAASLFASGLAFLRSLAVSGSSRHHAPRLALGAGSDSRCPAPLMQSASRSTP